VSIILTICFLAAGCTSDTKEELFAEGMKQVAANKPGNAIIYFKNALEKDQNYFDARFQLAKTYSAIGKVDVAEKELQKARRQRPSSKEVRIELAKVHVRTSKADEALSEIAGYATDACTEPDVLETAGLAHALKGNYNTALGLLKRAVASDNAPPSSALSLAGVYITMGREQEAEAQLAGILNNDSSSHGALSMLAELQTRKNEVDAAIKTYDQILKNNPDDGHAFYKKGMLHVRKHDLDAAVSFADAFIGKFPRQPEGYLLKGTSLFYKKSYKEAVTILQKSVSLQPSVSAYFFLGLCHYYTNELEQSMTHMQKVLNVNPSFSKAREIIALILLKKNRADDAIREIKKVLEHDDRDALAYNILGSAYMAKAMYAEGMQELNRALEVDPNLVDVHIKKGLFELKKGRSDAAETELSAAVRINPDLLDTRLILASYYNKRSEYDKAMQVLAKGIKKQKSDAVLYNMMADVHLHRKQVNEAVDTLHKATAADPVYDESYFKLAMIHYYRNEPEKSIAKLNSLLEIAPGNVKALLMTASIYEAKGKDREAANYFRRAGETGKTEGYHGLATYHLRKKEQDKALSALDAAIEKNPNEGSLYEFKGEILAAQKKYADAIKTFEELEKINAQAGLSYLVKAYILMDKPEKALEKIRTEIKKRPERIDLAAEMSRIYLLMGKRQDAVENATQIIRNKPESPIGYMTLAGIYKESKELEKGIEVLKSASRIKDADLRIMLGNFHSLKKEHALALERYREAEAIKPGYIPALFQKGSLLHAIGKKNEAIAEYHKILRLSQNNVPTLNNIAYLYAEDNRDLPMALQLASRAYMLTPNDGSVQDTLGYVLLKNKKFDEAEKILKKASEAMPGNPSIHYHLALAYKERNNGALAIEQVRKSLSTGDFPEADQAKVLLAQLNGGKTHAPK
jgi:putative PEP-CTERM system TPR-repeat lipoprotein